MAKTITTLRLSTGAALLAVLLAACGTPSNHTPQSAQNAPAATAQARQDVIRADVARGLYELAYSPSEQAVFVASSGGFGADSAPSRVLRLDPQTLAVQQSIALERKAFGVVLDDTTGRLYVGNTVDTSVTVVDIKSNRVLGVIQLMNKVRGKDGKESYSHDLRELVIDPASQRLYVTGHSTEGSVLFVVDTRKMTVIKTIPGLGRAKAPGLFLDAERHRIFTSNLLGEVVLVDTRTMKVTRRIQTDAAQPMNLTYDPAGDRLFITDQGAENIRKWMEKAAPNFKPTHPGNRVLVLEVGSGRELASLPAPKGPLAIRLDAPNQRLYVTSRDGGKISIYNSTTYALIDTIDLPDNPQSLALDESRNVLYATVKNNKDKPKDANESVVRIQLPATR